MISTILGSSSAKIGHHLVRFKLGYTWLVIVANQTSLAEMKYIQNGKEIKWLEEDPSPPSKVSRISRKYYRYWLFTTVYWPG